MSLCTIWISCAIWVVRATIAQLAQMPLESRKSRGMGPIVDVVVANVIGALVRAST